MLLYITKPKPQAFIVKIYLRPLIIMNKPVTNILIAFILLLVGVSVSAHDSLDSQSHADKNLARYLGNEGVLISINDQKIVFDPFFHNSYGNYTLVPQTLRKKIFHNQAPFNDITAIFISHAHGDHFDAKDVAIYLKSYSKVKLFAPAQAITALQSTSEYEKIKPQLVAVPLALGDKPWQQTLGALTIEAVRIPHAGWPGRADIENIVFRVTSHKNYSVMHFGDAETKNQFYQPYTDFWQKQNSDLALVPYWFFGSKDGLNLVNSVINAKKAIGVHVPTQVPSWLKNQRQYDYFSQPDEMRELLSEE
jgi:L-ascorbate metabolism protein UlaG (beta-lactamase superfamily)